MDEGPAAAPPRMWLRHLATVLLVGLYCALVAPSVATVLMSVRANGLTYHLPAALMLAPLAILLAGPAAFLLGVVFGWMLLVLAGMGLNHLGARVALAVLVASVAWWLADPLPEAVSDAGGPSGSALGDWLVWAGTAAATALIFTRGWVARRLAGPAARDVAGV